MSLESVAESSVPMSERSRDRGSRQEGQTTAGLPGDGHARY